MILHGFAGRSSKNAVLYEKALYLIQKILPASTQNMNDGIKTGSKAGGNGNFVGGQALWAKLGAKLGAPGNAGGNGNFEGGQALWAKLGANGNFEVGQACRNSFPIR